MRIKHIHKHIDNGGVTVEVCQTDDKYKNLSVKFDTSYHGYPNISCELNLWGELGVDFLKELGLMFIEASQKVKEEEQKQKQH